MSNQEQQQQNDGQEKVEQKQQNPNEGQDEIDHTNEEQKNAVDALVDSLAKGHGRMNNGHEHQLMAALPAVELESKGHHYNPWTREYVKLEAKPETDGKATLGMNEQLLANVFHTPFLGSLLIVAAVFGVMIAKRTMNKSKSSQRSEDSEDDCPYFLQA